METAVLTKVCKDCSQEKSLTDFSPHPTCKNGVKPRCKVCEAIVINNIYHKRPEVKKTAIKKWRSECVKLNKTKARDAKKVAKALTVVEIPNAVENLMVESVVETKDTVLTER